MPTIAEIANAAYTAVGTAIPGVIKSATLTRTIQGEYDAEAGAYATTTQTATGRAVFDVSKPISDLFPDYVVGPTDKLVYLEGLSLAPKEGDALSAGGDFKVRAVADIALAGGLYAAVVQ